MPLKPEDFRNPMFDKQKIAQRQVPVRPGVRTEADDEEFEEFAAGREPKRRTEAAIEGTTFTDEYVEVGFTYYRRRRHAVGGEHVQPAALSGHDRHARGL